MTELRRLTGLVIISSCLMWASPAAADPITELNVIAADTIFGGGRPAGASPLLDFAMVHAAIHDAVQAYERRFQPYAVRIYDVSGSPVAAAARAARDVLVNRFPLQTASIHAKYLLFLTNHGLTEADEGTRVGDAAATAIIARRANDGSYPTPPPPPDLGGTGAGQWRPTPPALPAFSTPWLGAVEPFTMDFNAQFRARRPPALTSREYARGYNEVKALGGAVGYPGVTRTPDQTQTGYFWSGNTIALFEGMIRGLVGACEIGPRQQYCERLSRLGDSARLFALANLAGADAGIRSWNSKKSYNFWRPITAIQQLLPGDNDGNPETEADATW
ncbi:MAG TPA: vanadium-dependent haloperoxidase, partial [Gemmatimonadaceae bacterium]|nr:vanadium-dependent haloperoxidase [Gemmatimonadaceae bacterium]